MLMAIWSAAATCRAATVQQRRLEQQNCIVAMQFGLLMPMLMKVNLAVWEAAAANRRAAAAQQQHLEK